MTSIIYKPISSKGGKPPLMLVDGGSRTETPTITLNGKVYQGRYVNNEGTIAQYQFPGLPLGAEGAQLSYGGQTQTINTGSRFEGNQVGGLSASGGPGSIGGGGIPGQFAPTQFGNGFVPAYLGGQIPQFNPVQYNPIPVPFYQQYDPAKYMQQYSPVIQAQMLKNFNFAEGLSLSTLSDELKGLKAYAPAATALAQSLANVNNVNNQAARTGQLNQILPGVVRNLNQQSQDAAVYASGHLPNSFDDNALEAGIRSQAADRANTAGIGATSGAARNISDFMNAQQRLQISQYGNQLEATNAQQRAALELAPTEYLNNGQQLNANPSLSPSQLIGSYFTQGNTLGTIPTTTALQSQINQSQYSTGLNQQVSEFNAQNQLQTAMYNASNIYAAQLNGFNYNTGFAQNVANIGTSTIQQNMQLGAFNKAMGQAQTATTISSVLQGLGIAPNIIKSIQGLIGSSPDLSGIVGSTQPTTISDPFNLIPGGAGNYFTFGGTDSVGNFNFPSFNIDTNSFSDVANFNPPDFSNINVPDFGIPGAGDISSGLGLTLGG